MPSLMKDIQEADVHGKPRVVDMAGSEEGVDVPATELAISMAKRLWLVDPRSCKLEPSTIRRVPPNLREGDHKAYDPQILSIGPYHRGKPNLEAMEERKWRYLHNVLTRNLRASCIHATGSEMSSELQKFINTARQWEARARTCYAETMHLASDEFVEMMVLDSCFMLELLIKFYVRAERKDDPVFAVAWILPLIRRDLLKLENQIPFFLLEELFALFPQSSKTTPFPLPALKELAFAYLVWRKCPDPAALSGLEVHHLLHLYHWILMPTPPSPVTCNPKPSPLNLKRPWLSLLSLSVLGPKFKKSTERWRSLGTIPCAAELQRAGIKFRQRTATDNLLDIRFRGTVLEIPRLAVVDGTSSIFRNLIAFEQCFSDGGNPLLMKYFTSYALFLDCIIDTPRDVQILEKHGIIENKLGSDEEVVLLFNQLCKEVIISYDKHHFADLFKIVNSFYGSKLHKRWARKRC